MRYITLSVSVVVLVGISFVAHQQTGLVQKPTFADRFEKQAEDLVPAADTKGPEVITVYYQGGKPLATFTKGARTVVFLGPSRTFTEPGTTEATITTSAWVRIYPKPFDGNVDRDWVAKTSAENADQSTLDVLQEAMQYIDKAPSGHDESGKLIYGDASYGPLATDSDRQGGSDFNDYMSIPYTYGGVVDDPEPNQIGSLDCSGFMRMIWGYRNGLPLSLAPDSTSIPRRANQIVRSAPGVMVIPDSGKQINNFSFLQAGDLVFQSVDPRDGKQIDHVGMYLGLDSRGHQRFISSRQAANGPTFGDVGGKSILDGDGLYAENFRAVRRL